MNIIIYPFYCEMYFVMSVGIYRPTLKWKEELYCFGDGRGLHIPIQTFDVKSSIQILNSCAKGNQSIDNMLNSRQILVSAIEASSISLDESPII
jgi:hypothetical protein